MSAPFTLLVVVLSILVSCWCDHYHPRGKATRRPVAGFSPSDAIEGAAGAVGFLWCVVGVALWLAPVALLVWWLAS